MKTIFLSGNCFWCLEAVFQKIKGVEIVESGYYSLNEYVFKFMPNDKVEAIKVVFDEEKVNLNVLLDIFFHSHIPTINSWKKEDCFAYMYRSSIICCDDLQVVCAEGKINEINSLKIFDQEVQTKIIKYLDGAFTSAGKKDQNYYLENPTDGYCTSIIEPKLDKIKNKFNQHYES